MQYSPLVHRCFRKIKRQKLLKSKSSFNTWKIVSTIHLNTAQQSETPQLSIYVHQRFPEAGKAFTTKLIIISQRPYHTTLCISSRTYILCIRMSNISDNLCFKYITCYKGIYKYFFVIHIMMTKIWVK